jgi:hypothetical protein
MIKYNIDTFLEINNTINEKVNIYGSNLKQNTLKKLLILSKSVNNKSENKNENVWKSKSLNFNENKINDQILLNQTLNKLLDKNKDKLFPDIFKIIDNNINLTKDIYKVSKIQNYYSEIFTMLCNYIYINLNNNKKNIFLKLLLECVESDFKNRSTQYITGNMLFLSYLYNNKLIVDDIIEYCINDIINYINSSEDFKDELIDKEINSLYTILSVTKFKISFNKFQIIKNLINNKQRVKNSKSKFKLLDIMEIFSK